jgi:transglutaminase-like putative cysteine protease
MQSNDKKEYLIPTTLCDCNNPLIVEKAKNLTEGLLDDVEKAKKIFYYIRDEFPYRVDPYFKTASNTLKQKYGFCVSKANLQIAFLRSLGIPARYHICHLKTECIEPFFPEKLIEKGSDIIDHHGYCECFLNDQWVACDATIDKGLIDGAKEKGILGDDVYSKIDWDGKSNLEIFTPWKIKEVGSFSDIDKFWIETLDKHYRPKILMKLGYNMAFKYSEKIRK